MLPILVTLGCGTGVIALDPSILATTGGGDCGRSALSATCGGALSQSYEGCLGAHSGGEPQTVPPERCRLGWADEAAAAASDDDRTWACARASACAGP